MNGLHAIALSLRSSRPARRGQCVDPITTEFDSTLPVLAANGVLAAANPRSPSKADGLVDVPVVHLTMAVDSHITGPFGGLVLVPALAAHPEPFADFQLLDPQKTQARALVILFDTEWGCSSPAAQWPGCPGDCPRCFCGPGSWVRRLARVSSSFSSPLFHRPFR